MPKKFKGENSKAAVAKARKQEVRDAENAKKEKEKEDEYWRDDDKHCANKQKRKEDKEKKRVEQLEKKKELQKLHDEEMESIKVKKPATVDKMTRTQIAERLEKDRTAAAAAAEKEKEETHLDKPLEENLNKLQLEGEARSVEAALSVLSEKEAAVDHHPEKRMKAAYKKYEDTNIPILKQENPNMKLSQLKHMLWKDWMKSPDNPLNQSAES
ncbi:coiled-coil domain-containing protein 124-A-like [Mytilus galloprovincialis]|uniref:coiled-coil domain-containing protein 124-A-like n=1 Tax=Mytilus galloprovincialis TaxID=29158 RepID=UPI003F7BC31A